MPNLRINGEYSRYLRQAEMTEIQSPFLPNTNIQFACLEAKVEELLANATYIHGGCLICHLAPNAKGYCPVGIGGRNGIKFRAHRLVYIVRKGPISPDLMALHTCDRRNCIQPDHIYAGTAAQNTVDMMERGRNSNGDGSKEEALKIETAKRIRLLLGLNLSNREIARRLYLSPSTITNYLNENGVYHDYILD